MILTAIAFALRLMATALIGCAMIGLVLIAFAGWIVDHNQGER